MRNSNGEIGSADGPRDLSASVLTTVSVYFISLKLLVEILQLSQ